MISYSVTWIENNKLGRLEMESTDVWTYKHFVSNVKNILDDGLVIIECKEKYKYQYDNSYTEYNIINEVIHDFIML